jgi:acyl-CoA thioesterase II
MNARLHTYCVFHSHFTSVPPLCRPLFYPDSSQCYFLTSASPATPIIYYVEKLRQGKTYVTCAVKAVQKGSMIFTLMCSFQKPEFWQPSSQWSMPTVPPPEACLLEEVRLRKALTGDLPSRIRSILEEGIAVNIVRLSLRHF